MSTRLAPARRMAITERDTCRKYVLPKLQAAGWEDDPHLLATVESKPAWLLGRAGSDTARADRPSQSLAERATGDAEILVGRARGRPLGPEPRALKRAIGSLALVSSRTMKVCLVLGAGASLANAVHFRPHRRRDTWPPLDLTFFETVEARKIALTPALRSYCRSFLGITPTPATLRERRMEQMFADAFFDFQESPGDARTLDAYIDLVDLYLRVIRDTTNWLCDDGRTGTPVGRLLTEAAAVADEVTVVTFNHDLVIENEIHRRVTLRKRWCLDEGYGTISASFDPLYPAPGSPMFPMHQDGTCDHNQPFRVLKLHGSLNWTVRINSTRPTANFLRGEGPARLKLVTGRQVLGREIYVRSGGGKGRTQWKLWPVVVPPVYGKQTLRGDALQACWDDARSALERADRVAFFGYSLPELDIDAEKLFERGLTQNQQVPWVDVINPAPSSAARFGGVSSQRPLRWYPDVPRFVASGAFR